MNHKTKLLKLLKTIAESSKPRITQLCNRIGFWKATHGQQKQPTVMEVRFGCGRGGEGRQRVVRWAKVGHKKWWEGDEL